MKRDRTNKLPQVLTDVPESIMQLAWQRSGPFLQHMWICKYDLKSVVISAYLQGVHDTVEAQTVKE